MVQDVYYNRCFEKHGWGATCLVEDMEFTMKSLAEGIKTTWAHDAIVYDENHLLLNNLGTSVNVGHKVNLTWHIALFRRC